MTPPPTFDRWLNRTVNVLVVGIVAFALFQPGGVVSERWRAWQRDRLVEKELSEGWQAMTNGSGRSPVLVTFTDYQCQFCRMAEDSIRLLEEVGVDVIFRHLPLTQIHSRAAEAAAVAICAEEQDVGGVVHDFLTRTSEWESAGKIDEFGPLVALVPAPDALRACLDSDRPALRLAADAALAERLGIVGTPTFVGPEGISAGIASVSQLEALAKPE